MPPPKAVSHFHESCIRGTGFSPVPLFRYRMAAFSEAAGLRLHTKIRFRWLTYTGRDVSALRALRGNPAQNSEPFHLDDFLQNAKI